MNKWIEIAVVATIITITVINLTFMLLSGG